MPEQRVANGWFTADKLLRHFEKAGVPVLFHPRGLSAELAVEGEQRGGKAGREFRRIRLHPGEAGEVMKIRTGAAVLGQEIREQARRLSLVVLQHGEQARGFGVERRVAGGNLTTRDPAQARHVEFTTRRRGQFVAGLEFHGRVIQVPVPEREDDQPDGVKPRGRVAGVGEEIGQRRQNFGMHHERGRAPHLGEGGRVHSAGLARHRLSQRVPRIIGHDAGHARRRQPHVFVRVSE